MSSRVTRRRSTGVGADVEDVGVTGLSAPTAGIPEPTSAVLFALALGFAGLASRR